MVEIDSSIRLSISITLLIATIAFGTIVGAITYYINSSYFSNANDFCNLPTEDKTKKVEYLTQARNWSYVGIAAVILPLVISIIILFVTLLKK